VKLVPGWSVTIPPRLIGVPDAATPGLVPHCEVLAVAGPLELELAAGVAAALDVDPAAGLLELELLLHPARTPIAITTTAAPASRERRREYLFMCSAFSWLTAKYFPNGRRRAHAGKTRCPVRKAKNTLFLQVNRRFFALPLHCAFSVKLLPGPTRRRWPRRPPRSRVLSAEFAGKGPARLTMRRYDRNSEASRIRRFPRPHAARLPGPRAAGRAVEYCR
jgi:hypothetical protein